MFASELLRPLRLRPGFRAANAAVASALDGLDGSLVHSVIGGGGSPLDRPLQTAMESHFGVDLGADRYTKILAASSGVVIVSRCDVGNCDRDGSPSTPGCGW